MTYEFKPLKTDFEKKSTLNISSVEPATLNRINSFINLINEKNTSGKKFDRGTYILNLIEKDLNGLILDNTFIGLDKQYTFNRNDLHDNNKATATTKPILDKEDAIIITEVPNNLDEYDEDERTYCYNGDKSIHAGYYIFNDIHYFFIYDSKEETIEVKIVDPANMKYYVHDDKLKEKLENDNSFVMDSLGNGLSIIDLHKTTSRPIMYKFTNYFELKRIDYGKPIRMDLVFNYFFEL